MVTKEKAELTSEVDQTSEIVTDEVARILESQQNLIVSVATAEVVEQIIEEIKQKTSAKVLDCEQIDSKNSRNDRALTKLLDDNFLTEVLIEILGQFSEGIQLDTYYTKISENDEADQCMPAFDQHVLVFKKILGKLRQDFKTDKLLLLVKNLDELEKGAYEPIRKLLFEQLFDDETCKVVIFRTANNRP